MESKIPFRLFASLSVLFVAFLIPFLRFPSIAMVSELKEGESLPLSFGSFVLGPLVCLYLLYTIALSRFLW